MATTVWHGHMCSISPYNVVQHHYSPVERENGLVVQGYAELLEFVNGPADKRFVVHLFLRQEGSSCFVYSKLRFAKVGYGRCLNQEFVRSRDLWLPGCVSWEHTGHILPWFYNQAEVDVAAML